ncbi:MAG: type II toxin-antitoxin system PemK/MazF family toxin [Gammaproteobacteria bacterium]|nr:MAG: type II toxin-antitoxin system PemK/MazF family toxin [Gammaproteobacteria bacterium]
MHYKQYSIIIVNLNPTIGSEITKVRPCIVISPNQMNYNNLIVAPLTSTNKNYPTRIKITEKNYIVLEQIRTISTLRVTKATDIKINSSVINKIKKIIKTMLVD